MATGVAPAPFSLSPSWSFGGDDGSWSTFRIGVGTPPQYFDILPSTTGSETWVPNPIGCEGVLVNIQDCGLLRGVQNFDGDASRGYETDASSTWDLIGIYELSTEQNLWGPEGNPGQYGLDTVTLGAATSGKNVGLKGQTIASTASENVWLGSLGLGTSEGSFDVHPGAIPSLISTMMSQNYTPSLSFAYTAGASYGECDIGREVLTTLTLPLRSSLAAGLWKFVVRWIRSITIQAQQHQFHHRWAQPEDTTTKRGEYHHAGLPCGYIVLTARRKGYHHDH